MHAKADAFVMVIMSHGDESGNLLSSDEKLLSINNDIVAPFDGENWPIMIGKPKLFLIQACRRGIIQECERGGYQLSRLHRFSAKLSLYTSKEQSA